MRFLHGTAGLAVFAVALGLSAGGDRDARAGAVYQFSNDNTLGVPNSDLTSTVTLDDSTTGELKITITSPSSTYGVADFYFDLSGGPSAFTYDAADSDYDSAKTTSGGNFPNTTPTIVVGPNGSVGPYGKFDYQLDFGNSKNDRLAPDSTVTIAFTYSGSQISGGYGGTATMHFYPPTGTTGPASGLLVTSPAPEPSTLFGASVAMVGAVLYCVRKRSSSSA